MENGIIIITREYLIARVYVLPNFMNRHIMVESNSLKRKWTKYSQLDQFSRHEIKVHLFRVHCCDQMEIQV